MSSVVTLDHASHQYRVDGEIFSGPSVTQALAQCGLADFSFVDEELRRSSMARGTSVHWMLALQDQGGLEYRRVPKALRPFRLAYVNWKKASGFIPYREWIERSFVSELGYVGTVDRVGDFPWVNGKRSSPAVIDLKTGSAIHPATKFQLALYAHVAKVFRRIAVLLTCEGKYKVQEYPFHEFNLDLSVGMEAVRRWKRY